MNPNTSIEVKCECKIPFHSELVDYLQDLSINLPTQDLSNEIQHKEAMRQALSGKLLFVKIHLEKPIKEFRRKLLNAVKRMLNKDIVGTIKEGKDEITLIFL